MFEWEDCSVYVLIVIGCILEKCFDGSVVFDLDFIFCYLNVVGIFVLYCFINEMLGLMCEWVKNIV